jgi:hypothetical protein
MKGTLKRAPTPIAIPREALCRDERPIRASIWLGSIIVAVGILWLTIVVWRCAWRARERRRSEEAAATYRSLAQGMPSAASTVPNDENAAAALGALLSAEDKHGDIGRAYLLNPQNPRFAQWVSDADRAIAARLESLRRARSHARASWPAGESSELASGGFAFGAHLPKHLMDVGGLGARLRGYALRHADSRPRDAVACATDLLFIASAVRGDDTFEAFGVAWNLDAWALEVLTAAVPVLKVAGSNEADPGEDARDGLDGVPAGRSLLRETIARLLDDLDVATQAAAVQRRAALDRVWKSDPPWVVFPQPQRFGLTPPSVSEWLSSPMIQRHETDQYLLWMRGADAVLAPNWPAAAARGAGSVRLPLLLGAWMDLRGGPPFWPNAFTRDTEGRTAIRYFDRLAERRLVAFSLAWHWYVADHNGLPPMTAKQLTPDYLPAIPSDPYSGTSGPLSYDYSSGVKPRVFSVGSDPSKPGGASGLTIQLQ